MSDMQTCSGGCDRIVDLSCTKGGSCPACGVLCGDCADGHGHCDACGQFTCDNAVDRLCLPLLGKLICEACVTKEAQDSAPTSHEFLVKLTAFLADQGTSSDEIAAAVEKPWKWKDEYAVGVLYARSLERARAEQAEKVRAFHERCAALDVARPTP
jgi:hypothetical protein